MNVIDTIRTEFEYETSQTRKVLDRLPWEHADWTPHEKSMTLGALASHLVESLSWIDTILAQDVFTFDPNEWKPWFAASRAEVLSKFDANVATALAAMKGYPSERLLVEWRMEAGGQVMFRGPRLAILKSFAINHLVHHRAQLGVYLRLKDVPLPQLYGPTADEPNMGA